MHKISPSVSGMYWMSLLHLDKVTIVCKSKNNQKSFLLIKDFCIWVSKDEMDVEEVKHVGQKQPKNALNNLIKFE